jgi:ferredoxin
LARRLDEIPNGFPRTESGVEIELLAKIFSEDEARIASEMRLTPEPAADIAARAGVEEAAAARILKRLAKKALVRGSRSEGRLSFGLRPFIVGIYESHLPRMDAEFARLFERFIKETRGGTLFESEPAIHRVIPVDQAIPFEVEVFPHERAAHLVEGAKSWGLRDCICRVQKGLIGEGCGHSIENCIMLAPVEDAFAGAEVTRPVTKEEALAVLREAAGAGLVHSAVNTREGIHYICNCCTCCCGVLRGVAEFGHRGAVAPSGFRARVDPDACTACGACIDRCQFGALSIAHEACVVAEPRCVGCGLCVESCPVGALSLERRPSGSDAETPVDEREWLDRRARERGISLDEVL